MLRQSSSRVRHALHSGPRGRRRAVVNEDVRSRGAVCGIRVQPSESLRHLRRRLCAGYYGYKWAEGLSASVLVIRRQGVLVPGAGAVFARAPGVGGSRPAPVVPCFRGSGRAGIAVRHNGISPRKWPHRCPFGRSRGSLGCRQRAAVSRPDEKGACTHSTPRAFAKRWQKKNPASERRESQRPSS